MRFINEDFVCMLIFPLGTYHSNHKSEGAAGAHGWREYISHQRLEGTQR